VVCRSEVETKSGSPTSPSSGRPPMAPLARAASQAGNLTRSGSLSPKLMVRKSVRPGGRGGGLGT
jgi:hypothetical protein